MTWKALPPPLGLVDPDRAAVALDDRGQRQADAARSAPTRVQPAEQLEDALALGRRDAVAVVGDGELPAEAAALGADVDAALAAAVADRVGDQLGEQRAQLVRVAGDDRERRRG